MPAKTVFNLLLSAGTKFRPPVSQKEWRKQGSNQGPLKSPAYHAKLLTISTSTPCFLFLDELRLLQVVRGRQAEAVDVKVDRRPEAGKVEEGSQTSDETGGLGTRLVVGQIHPRVQK